MMSLSGIPRNKKRTKTDLRLEKSMIRQNDHGRRPRPGLKCTDEEARLAQELLIESLRGTGDENS